MFWSLVFLVLCGTVIGVDSMRLVDHFRDKRAGFVIVDILFIVAWWLIAFSEIHSMESMYTLIQ